MIKKNRRLIPLLLFSIVMTEMKAQNAVPASGGQAEGTGGTVSYSVGQLDFITISSTTGSVSQGVQQPFVSTTLPVTLLSLKAVKKENKVSVNWETVTEINSDRFIVQRSKDGLSFSSLSEVTAAGNSTLLKQYSTDDIHPLPGWNFYRIQLVDKNGSFVYSKVVSVNFSIKERFAIVYPNPTKQNIVLQVYDIINGSLSYRLYDGKGDLLLINRISNSKTNIFISTLPSGKYYLKIIENNKEIKTFQIIKTN